MAAEEARELRAHERFLSLLEKNPRRGTALDRVYGYHVERGSLDNFIKSYEDRVAKNPGDGTGWLILGLLEGQRGQDAAAVAALQKAEATRPNDCLPAYYLGQALVLVGQPEQAAAAFERALERKPPRNDLLEIFQALGRVYQRTQKNDQALQVWGRLETLFPDDARVQEQIALALAEENQPAQALPRFELLAKKATDPFRQVQLAMQAADLKVRLGQSEQALHDFETMLGKLRPDSWLHREVRRKIEEVFLRNDDQAGLVSYYEKMDEARSPRTSRPWCGWAGRWRRWAGPAEAQAWYEKAIKLAPEPARPAAGPDVAVEPGPEIWRGGGAVRAAGRRPTPTTPTRCVTGAHWCCATRPVRWRSGKAAAAAIWRKLLVAKPNDAVATAQVADLFRQAEMVDDALALYKKAIELAPNNPQYHEYLGEYLHQLKRSDEARAAWARIAEGPNRNAKNLTRLAEVLAGFGYVKEAIGAARARRSPWKRTTSACGSCWRAIAIGWSGMTRPRRNWQPRASWPSETRKRRPSWRRGSRTTRRPVGWPRGSKRCERSWMPTRTRPRSAGPMLARYLEADGKLPEAVRAADRAIAIGRARSRRGRWRPGSASRPAAWATRPTPCGGLTEIDRRNRTEHLTGIARLESRLGRIDAALKAGRDLLAAAPRQPRQL